MSSPASENTGDSATLTTQNVAKLLMLNGERIRQLVKDGYIEKSGRNKYSLISAVQGYIKFLKDAERRSSKSASATRWQDIRTERAEMEMRKERRELVQVADAEIVLDRAASLIKTRFLAVPARFTRDIAERQRLEALIEQTLNSLAVEFEKSSAALQNGEDVKG